MGDCCPVNGKQDMAAPGNSFLGEPALGRGSAWPAESSCHLFPQLQGDDLFPGAVEWAL